MRRILSALGALLLLAVLPAFGQRTVSTAGHDATGNGGSLSVTVGQVGHTNTGTSSGTVAAGVQQPLVVIQTDVAELPGGPSAQVFPNPAHDQLTVQVDQLDGGTSYCELQDAAGRIVLQERITATHTLVDVQHLAHGTYTLSIRTDDAPIGTFTVIKQ